MIALLQRVARASVVVDDTVVGRIDAGLLAFVCAQRDDREREADALVAKMLAFRMFSDEQGRMNRSIREVAGGLLLVPQFTLAADTRSGTRPSFTPAAAPGPGRRLFEHFVARCRASGLTVHAGVFGADMKVHLTNDGPVTFWLNVAPPDPSLETKLRSP